MRVLCAIFCGRIRMVGSLEANLIVADLQIYQDGACRPEARASSLVRTWWT